MCTADSLLYEHPKSLLIEISSLPFAEITTFVDTICEEAYLLPDGLRVKLIHRVIQATVRVSRSILKNVTQGKILIEAQANPLIATIHVRDFNRQHEISLLPEIDNLAESVESLELIPTPYILCIASIAPAALHDTRPAS